jgi:N-acetylglucosaminyl-diphospho-decaprenol L-rhamnosyltransferase
VEGFAAKAACYRRRVSVADVVVVSYNSESTLRPCVEGLAAAPDLNVIVVDNASRDRSVESVRGLRLTMLALDDNRGFAYGCNRGWQSGSAPAVLFLNPDARIGPDAVRALATSLERRPEVGLLAPRIRNDAGELDYSLRRFPRARSTYAQALFLHRLFPKAAWSDEVVRSPEAYTSAHPAEWVSGACVLARREALEQVGGWDEGYFLYGEDVDLCRRLQLTGWVVRYEPSVEAVHAGGASAPRAQLLSTLTASRIRYARAHRGALLGSIDRVGIALGELTHALLSTKGADTRAGHWQALRISLSGDAEAASRSARSKAAPTAVDLGRLSD